MMNSTKKRTIHNPYKRRRTPVAPAPAAALNVDFDAICLPDAVLLQAVQAVEQRLWSRETQQQQRIQPDALSSPGSRGMWPVVNGCTSKGAAATTGAFLPAAQQPAYSSHSHSMRQFSDGHSFKDTSSRTVTQSSNEDALLPSSGSNDDQYDAGLSRDGVPQPRWSDDADEDSLMDDDDDDQAPLPGALTQMVQEEECQAVDKDRQKIASHLVNMRRMMESFVKDQVQKTRFGAWE